jgi:hypothetical protein
MAKAFAFEVKLNQNQLPTTEWTKGIKFTLMNDKTKHKGYYLTNWKKKIKFTLIIDKLPEGTEKEYRGYYCWNSNGKEWIEWEKDSEKPNFQDPELAKTAETLIIEKLTRELENLAREKQTHILWKIPSRKNIKVDVWLNLKKEEKLSNGRKLISVPITLYLENQKFDGEYQVEVKEENTMIDYNFKWKTPDQEEMLCNLNFYSDYQEDVKNPLNDLLEVEEIYSLENTSQEKNNTN